MARYPTLTRILGANWKPGHSPSFETDDSLDYGDDMLKVNFNFETKVNARKAFKEPVAIGEDNEAALDDLQIAVENHVEAIEKKVQKEVEAELKSKIKGIKAIQVDVTTSSTYGGNEGTREQILQTLEQLEITADVYIWFHVPLKEMGETVKKAVESVDV
jgi:hypothetical protein